MTLRNFNYLEMVLICAGDSYNAGVIANTFGCVFTYNKSCM